MKRFLLFLVAGSIACASSPPPAVPRAAESEEAEVRDDVPIGGAIEELIEGRTPLESFRVRVLWRSDDRMLSADLRGDGFGVWDSSAQIRLSRPQVTSVIETLRGFGAMKHSYGQETDLLKLEGMVTVSVGPLERTVYQYATGPQQPDFASLAERILALAQGQAASGVRVGSLAEGFERLEDGTLDPRTFDLDLVRRSESRGATPPEGDGWLLHLSGRAARVAVYDRRKGYGPARVRTIPEEEFRGLIRVLRDTDMVRLPQNLFAADYLDLHARVLDQAIGRIARSYADAARANDPRAQRSFDRLVESLTALEKEVERSGELETGTSAR